MKTMEERTAEVRRRGRAGIQRRKRRRKLAAALGVPAVLCLALLLPFSHREPPADGAAPENSCPPEAPAPRQTVLVQQGGSTTTVPEPERLAELLEEIASNPPLESRTKTMPPLHHHRHRCDRHRDRLPLRRPLPHLPHHRRNLPRHTGAVGTAAKTSESALIGIGNKERSTFMKPKKLLIGIVLAGTMVFAGCAPAGQAVNLMDPIQPAAVSPKAPDDAFKSSSMGLALNLFQASVGETPGENVLISPLSIQLALAMTANGAAGQTREEMEALLGAPLEDLNGYLHTYGNALPSTDSAKLHIANSIWFRNQKDRLTMEENFLQTNADYYGAEIYAAPFDTTTLKEINRWTSRHTEGMIPKILEEIDGDTVMYLINALAFDARWEEPYQPPAIDHGIFTAVTGDIRNVEMMRSSESLYLDDGSATGFLKSYKGSGYRFGALLPNKGVDICDYIAGLTPESLKNTLERAQSQTVSAQLPQFESEYGLTMNRVLSSLGMPTAFQSDQADFSRMGRSTRGNLFLGRVVHKTFISVDAQGTKAGAVTRVEVADGCVPEVPKEVILDRPFVYFILDTETNLPVFIGVLLDIAP